MSFMYDYEVEKRRRMDERAQAANERALRKAAPSGRKTPTGLIVLVSLLVSFFIFMLVINNQPDGDNQNVSSPPVAEIARHFDMESSTAAQHVELIEAATSASTLSQRPTRTGEQDVTADVDHFFTNTASTTVKQSIHIV